MAYLVIPEITDHEEIVTYSGQDTEWQVTIRHGNVVTTLMQMSTQGQMLPLVVLFGELTIALDDVYITSVQVGGDPDPMAVLTFSANEVRYI